MDIFRTMLFVPGHNREWMLKADRFGADALILDLEDSVAVSRKQAAREMVAEILPTLSSGAVCLFVRVNGWATGELLKDLDAVCRAGLRGLMLPKVERAADVESLAYLLAEMETERGLAPGRIEIVPLLESALGIRNTYEIAMASPRVLRIPGAGAVPPGGDVNRAIGYLPTLDEQETLYLSSHIVLQARAAGIQNILSGFGASLSDAEVIRRSVLRARTLGANGGLAVHPTQVRVMNEIFSPSQQEIGHAAAIVFAMEEALRRGDAAARVGTMMVDYAHARSATDLLHRAASLGLPVPQTPDLAVPDRGLATSRSLRDASMTNQERR